MTNIHPQAQEFTNSIVQELQTGHLHIKPFSEHGDYVSITDELGNTIYKLSHSGWLSWYQYESWNRVKIGKRNRDRLLLCSAACHPDSDNKNANGGE